MNRLTDIYLGTTHSQIVYDPLGRMTSKQADGQAVFANASFAAAQGQPARPHAMKSAETAEGVFPSATQEITYTGFDKVKAIAEAVSEYDYPVCFGFPAGHWDDNKALYLGLSSRLIVTKEKVVYLKRLSRHLKKMA